MFIKLDYYAENVKKRGVIFAVFGLIFYLMIMKNNGLSQEQSLQVFSNMISNKVHNGFTLEERNDEFLFAVLSKGGKVVNHGLNFIIFCLTLGLWSFAWLYLTIEASKQKKVLVAIDEDGFPFEERCLVA